MDTRLATATLLGPRRYGVVNWLGLRTLISREIKRFMSIGAQTVLAPITSTLLLMLIFGAVRTGYWPGSTHPYVDGLAAGLVMMSVLSNAFQNSSWSMAMAKIQGNAADFLMSPLSAFELAVAFIVGAAARGLLVGAASLLVVSLIAGVIPVDVFAISYFAVMGSVIFGAIGLIAGLCAEKPDHIAAMTNFVVTPLTMLSGTFYSTKLLSAPLAAFSHVNPIFFLIDGFRYGFIGVSDAPLPLGALVSLVLALGLSTASWVLVKSGYRLRG